MSAPRPVSLVTGANKGIGYSTAEALGRMGHEVLVGARDPGRGEEAAASLRSGGVEATFVALDVTSDEQVKAAEAWIRQRYGRLDVLVNNAAVKLEFHPSRPSECPIEMVRETFETNVIGAIRVIQTMLPLIRLSTGGRIVNVSSGLGSLGLATTPGTKYIERPLLSYNTAKSALNSVTVQFANELRATAIKINAVDPGFTNTDMTRGAGSRSAAWAAAVVVGLATIGPDGPTGGFFDEAGPVPW